MKLETLKTIESALEDAIMAEEKKIREARAQLGVALRDALETPEIGRGKAIPIRPFSNGRLDVGEALRIIEETVQLTESDEVKEECERLFSLVSQNSGRESEADTRIAKLRAAANAIKNINWRE
nr:MAG TPA: hypothetical protein [Bacteriophage sp.]